MTEATPQDAPDATDESPAPEAAPLPWADVVPEHFQMLRLSPQPTDRNTGARPLRFVQYGYAERHNKTHSLLRMEVRLPGQKVRKEQNRLDIWVDHELHQIKIGPDSGLQIEPVSRGLGRFLLSQAVHWVQRKWSHYRVEGMALANKDALNEDTRLRRDQVLRSHGLEVEYADAQHLKGRCVEVQAGQLKGGWNTDKVQKVDILDAAGMLQHLPGGLCGIPGRAADLDCHQPLKALRVKPAPTRQCGPVGAGLTRDRLEICIPYTREANSA